MKFPNGQSMQCWYCNEKIKTGSLPENVVCPSCGHTLKVFLETNSKKHKK